MTEQCEAHRREIRPRSLICGAVAVAAAFTTAMGTGATAHAQPDAQVHYVALGDSYSAGVGGDGIFTWAGPCGRTDKAYPELIANQLREQGQLGSFDFPACAAATITNGNAALAVDPTQLAALQRDTSYVTITIGGNDAGFADVLISCTTSDDQGCADRLDRAKDYARKELSNSGNAKLRKLYDKIKEKSPRATEIVFGYPKLFDPTADCDSDALLSPKKRQMLNDAAELLNQLVAEAAQGHATFVPVDQRFENHRICSADPWIWGYLSGEGYSAQEIQYAGFHPNAAGYRHGYFEALNDVVSELGLR